MRCAGCGHFEDVHDLGTLKCPRETADKNGRRGTFREAEPLEYVEWFGLKVPLSPAQLKARAVEAAGQEFVGPRTPQVAARPPLGPAELAGGDGAKQATKMGRHAAGLGWSVSALYWRAYDGTEGCGIWLAKDVMRAVATWKRPPGNVGKLTGWATDTAYAWRADAERFPSKINQTDLERLLK